LETPDLEQACRNGIKGREALQDNERKISFSTSRIEELTEVNQKCLVEDQTLNVRMLEEMTGINTDTVHKVLIKDYFVHLLMPDQEHEFCIVC
jgi:hypothetical protein